MELYKEYPIRCKTCNEQISCFAPIYEQLLTTGLSEEEALNNLGITEWCSRISMLNPTIVTFNMENREVIEGFKSVDAAQEADAQNESTEHPIFNACMGLNTPIQQLRPLVTAPTLTTVVPRVTTNAPWALFQPPATTRPGIQTITLLQPATPRVQPVIQTITTQLPLVQPDIQLGTQTVLYPTPPGEQPVLLPTPPHGALLLSPPLIQPVIPDLDFEKDIEALGIGIPVTAPAAKSFQEPTIVGVPTINPDPTVAQAIINVGVKHQSRVLNGRTYIAQ